MVMYISVIKPTLDFLLSLFILFLFSPLWILVTLTLLLTNNGKPFFVQARPGKDERIFKVIKFASMNNKKDVNGKLLPDGERLTRIGKFIRKTSFDELPQLLNVLRGEMSLVGPRPLLVEYLPLYNKQQKRRHEVKPGITGWAQVNGRNTISWEQKFNYDVWYVDHISFLMDLKIGFMTIKKVLVSEGITQENEATMELFKGGK